MYYVVDANGNKVEGLSKQEMLAVLQQAIDDGDLESIDADSAFVSKLKCCVGGETYQIAFVTQAVYNQLKEQNALLANALYFITDDNSYNDIVAIVNGLLNGTETAKSAETATNATNAILNSDGTHSGFTCNANGVVQIDNTYIVEKKRLLFHSDAGIDISDGSSTVPITIGETNENLINKTLEFVIIDGEKGINGTAKYRFVCQMGIERMCNFLTGVTSYLADVGQVQIVTDLIVFKILGGTNSSPYRLVGWTSKNTIDIKTNNLYTGTSEKKVMDVYEIID